MLLPVLVAIGVMGWCMYLVDNQKPTQRKPPRPAQKDYVTLLPIDFEEQREIRLHNATGNR
jgi:hypothetical protein